MASSVLLRCRNPALSANAYRLSALLWHGGAQKQLYKRCNRWGICMSHRHMLKKIDEFGENYDELVNEWKTSLEHSRKKQSLLSTILEVVEDAEKEVVLEGLTTVNVADLGLSCAVTPQQPLEEHDVCLPVAEIKERVKLRIREKFDDQGFNSIADEMLKFNDGPFNSKTLKDIQDQVQLNHPPTYQITGDNLDLMVKVKHMGSMNQNNSIHWFNLNAVQNRVLGNHLDNTKPIKSVMEMENIDFLPSPQDNQKYLNEITALAARVVVKRIPAFESFKDVTVHHIAHKYSEVMKQKSEQVPLGLVFKNENVNEEMTDILQELHDKYLPVDRHESNGQEVVSVLERLFFGGDQLTDERATHCKDARSDGDTKFERLEGFFSKVEDWHAIRLLYQVLYDVFFKASSVNDIGTMCANMNVVNNCNAKTTNVQDNFNHCKNFVNLETDALITAAAMTYFGLENLDAKVDNVIPPKIWRAPKDKRRIWLHSHIQKMLSKFVMTEQNLEHEQIRQQVAEANRPRGPVVHNCRICGKQYKYLKARDNHERRLHPESCPPVDYEILGDSNEEVEKCNEATEANDKPRDDRYQYATLRLSMGILLRNFDDAVKEGDGDRIIGCWKFAMLIYKAYGHTKYALAALELQAFIMSMLSPRQAESLVWNRTLNNWGGAGCNISMDIKMEHLICLTKELLKHLGVNITENAAKRCSKAIGHVDQLVSSVDKELKVERPGGHHKIKKRDSDFRLLVNELHDRGRMFQCESSQEREYQVFANFKDSLIKGLDFSSVKKWITDRKKELHKMEPL